LNDQSINQSINQSQSIKLVVQKIRIKTTLEE